MTDIAAVKIVNDPQTQCIIYAIVPGERIACYTGENCMLQGLRVTGMHITPGISRLRPCYRCLFTFNNAPPNSLDEILTDICNNQFI